MTGRKKLDPNRCPWNQSPSLNHLVELLAYFVIGQAEEKSVRLALQENGICCKFKFKCTFWKLRDCKQKYFCIEKKIRLEKLLSPAAENQNQNGQKPGKLNLSQFVLVLKKKLNRTEASTFTPGRYQE